MHQKGAKPRALTRRASMEGAAGDGGEEYKLYGMRWVQLGLLSVLALLSDWACFATVGDPKAWTDQFHKNPEELIDLFLITNVAAYAAAPRLSETRRPVRSRT